MKEREERERCISKRSLLMGPGEKKKREKERDLGPKIIAAELLLYNADDILCRKLYIKTRLLG